MDKKILRHIGILATALGVSVIITQTPAKAHVSYIPRICKCIGVTTQKVYQTWNSDIESRYPYTSFEKNCVNVNEHYGFDKTQVGDNEYQVICEPQPQD